jgi:Tfp pilus assembly protein PilN
MIAYEALLTQSDSLARLQARRRQIEQIGGALRIEQAGAALLVTLTLPAQHAPEQFFPGMPLFPV